MDLIKHIDNCFKRMENENWDAIYFLIDIHGTVFHPSYKRKDNYEFYPYSKEVLQILSKMDKIKLILWTSTHKDKIEEYLSFFNNNDIKFDFVNENLEIKNDELCDFNKKFYFNVGIDDKFGFDAEVDWLEIFDLIKDF